MIYGTLELLGSALRPQNTSQRRAPLFPLTIGVHPPGTDAYDYFQFGRSNSRKNNFIFLDRDYYRNSRRYPKLNRVARFSFRIQGSPDTSEVKLLSTVINDDDERLPTKGISYKKFEEALFIDLVADVPLENGTIINTPGATFFWRSYESLINMRTQLYQLRRKVHRKLLEGKFITGTVMHIDFKGKFYALEPCQHIMSEGSVAFWTHLGIPQIIDSHDYITKCPFCETQIVDYPGYTEIDIDV